MAQTGAFQGANLAGSITGIAQAAGVIATTIAGISDMNKRRAIEANLNLMSEKEKIALANKIAASKDRNAKAQILVETVLSARNASADRAQKADTIKYVLIGVFGLGTLITLAWYLKN